MSDDLVRYFSTYSAMMAEDGDVKWVKYKDYKAATDRIEELEAKLETMIDPQFVENMVRLAEPMLSDALAAADKRIEELEKACNEWSEVSQANYQRAKEAESKLADAMEALQFYRSAVNLRIDCEITHAMQEAHSHAEAFIAKIKGEQQ